MIFGSSPYRRRQVLRDEDRGTGVGPRCVVRLEELAAERAHAEQGEQARRHHRHRHAFGHVAVGDVELVAREKSAELGEGMRALREVKVRGGGLQVGGGRDTLGTEADAYEPGRLVGQCIVHPDTA